MPTPRISLVVPFYDVEPFIAECLDSIERQSLPDLEVLLVDDGSRDGSRAIAETYCRRDGRFQMHVQENRGLADARNRGAARATGEYLWFVDSDDVLPSHAVEQMVDRLDATGSAVAVGNVRRFDEFTTEPSWGQRRSAATDRSGTSAESFPALVADRIACNKVFRRSFWNEHGYSFPDIRYEDYPVVLAALLDANSIDCVSEPVYYWRRRATGGSITQSITDVDNAFDRITSANLVLDLIDRRGSPAVAREVDEVLTRVDVPAVLAAFAAADEAAARRLAEGLAELVGRLSSPGAVAMGWRVLPRLLARVAVIALSRSAVPLGGGARRHDEAGAPLSLRSALPATGLLAGQLEALRARDHDFLRAAAISQGAADGRAPVRIPRERPWRREFDLGVGGASTQAVSRRRLLVPYWRHRLATTVESVRFEERELVVSASAVIREVTERPRVAAVARSGNRTVRGSIDRTDRRSGFVVRFDRAELQKLGSGTWRVTVRARHPWFRRRGVLANTDPATTPPAAVEPAPFGLASVGRVDERGRLVVDLGADAVFASVSVVDGMDVAVRPEAGDVSVRLLRSDGIVVDAGRRAGRTTVLSTEAVLVDEGLDDPITGIATYCVVDSVRQRPVYAGGRARPVRVHADSWMLVATRSLAGHLVIERSRPEPVVDAVAIERAQLVVTGSGPIPRSVEWCAVGSRRSSPSVIESVDTGTWCARADMGSLGALLDASRQPVLLLVDGRSARADGYMVARLPLHLQFGDSEFCVERRGRSIVATPY